MSSIIELIINIGKKAIRRFYKFFEDLHNKWVSPPLWTSSFVFYQKNLDTTSFAYLYNHIMHCPHPDTRIAITLSTEDMPNGRMCLWSLSEKERLIHQTEWLPQEVFAGETMIVSRQVFPIVSSTPDKTNL